MNQSENTSSACEFAVATALHGNASAIAGAMTSCGLGIRHWERRGGGRLAYRDADHHTFSLYLQGGREVRPADGGRRDGPRGGPGAICIMPIGRDTMWENFGYVRWAHIYCRPEHLLQATDGTIRDPRGATFGWDQSARALLEQFVLTLDWSDPADAMALEHALFALLARLTLRDPSPPAKRGGGLTASRMRRVHEYVEAPIGERITLMELAEVAELSVRQFGRAFAQSEGMPPYEWVLRRKLDRATAMIARGEPAAQAAAACGFSSQGHMTRRLRERGT